MRFSLKVVTAILAGLVMSVVLLPGTASAKNCGIYKEHSGGRVDLYQVTKTPLCQRNVRHP